MPINNGGQIRFMAENLLKTGLTAITSTGINPIYPISNLTSDFRGRPTRFRGRIVIDSTNNKIYINDGADKVATIASAEYTTRAAFASAATTALNAVSSSWTVVWNADLHSFVVLRTGGFTLRLSQTLNAAHVTMGFTGSTDLVTVNQLTADQKRFHWPNEWIKFDFGYFPDIGFLGIVSDSRYNFSLTEMANVRIQANTVDDFTAPPVDIVLDVTKKGIFKFFDDDDYNYRYWKLIIEDNNSTTDPTLGIMYLGEAHTFGDWSDEQKNKRYNDQGGRYSNEDTSEIAVSESGQIYALEKQTQIMYENIVIKMLNPDNKDFLNDIWMRFKKVRPFFISIDPKKEITNKVEDTTFICSFDAKPVFEHVTGNKYDTVIGVSEWL